VSWSGRRNQWSGGLARRATTASATGVVLTVVAATITAIAVFVVILGLVAIDAAMGWARRRGRQWLGRRGCNVGVEHRRGSRRPDTVHVMLLQE
jgi:hypothetical protein